MTDSRCILARRSDVAMNREDVSDDANGFASLEEDRRRVATTNEDKSEARCLLYFLN